MLLSSSTKNADLTGTEILATTLLILLILTLNNGELRTNPCNTPLVRFLMPERPSPSLTLNLQSINKFEINIGRQPLKFYLCKVSIILSPLTESKASLKLKKMANNVGLVFLVNLFEFVKSYGLIILFCVFVAEVKIGYISVIFCWREEWRKSIPVIWFREDISKQFRYISKI